MPPNSDVRPITANLPATLLKWRGYNISPRLAVWDPLRDWFASQGLHVFNHAPESTVVKPQVNELRAHDGTYSTHYHPPSISHEHRRAVHCIARTTDGRDVLIRVIAKGKVGLQDLDILQYIATGHRAFLGDNHCLPMLRTLVLEDMTFAVFPFMDTGFSYPWYHNVDEVFDAVLQVLQGFEFLHRHLIAHRDVGADNILINLAEGPLAPPQKWGDRPLPVRAFFPVRYYIIDFEFSVRFPEDSAPEQRVVTGLPAIQFGLDHPDDYGRELSPEMLLDKPHCPFKSDVYQLGKMFLLHFHLLEAEYPNLIETFKSMAAVDPIARPTAREALTSIHDYHDGFTRAQLKGPVPLANLMTMSPEEIFRRMREANARKVAREKKLLEAELVPSS